ncbi:SNF2-related protein [uncultured Bifidobacterium sp.]|uniref:SNF2-related protein n=1 Tax=uncultured Bifidobacterium sp. TaxID=165187 RepID=UPI002596F1D7|nr:SNF2-related protein [uncultured Bifidobacterium sp.]
MNWRNSVYGARNGVESNVWSSDDGPVYGRVPDELIPEERLRRLGGKSFYRAHEVIDSGRLHDLGYAYTDDGITLTALVDSADGYADDYSVTAHVDQNVDDLTASHCTCPAYGRFGAICKHVIALIMAYDEDPDAFEALDEDGGDASPARPRPSRGARTSRRLQAFMREREQSRQSDMQTRQLTLLKEIDAMSSSGGSAGAEQGGIVSRHLPIGSVVLRPELRRFGSSWAVRLRLTVPSRSAAYVVKDVAAFIDAVRHQEFRTYGRKLAFVHTRDTLSERSRIIFDVLERAVRIRESVTGGAPYYRRGAEADTVLLTGDETAELLAAFVDADAFLDYERPYRMRPEPVRVVDGDPDLGLALAWSDDAEGYVARHRLDVLDIVEGSSASFVAVAPSLSESLARRMGLSDAASGDDRVLIHRCSKAFMRARRAIDVLCGTERGEDMVVAPSDTDLFMRTVAPLFTPVTTDDGGSGETDPGTGASGNDVPGIPIRLPEEMLRLRREPCAIEIYLDRDQAGVTCDIRARYGDRWYHAFEGVREDASRRDPDAERLAVEAVLHYFPRPNGPLAFIEESDDDAIWRLLTEGLPVMRGLGEVFITPAFDGLLAAPRPTVRLGLSVRSGLVEISPIADEIDPDDVPGLLASYRRRKRFHRLRNGAFLDLSAVDADRTEETLSDLDLTLRDLELGSVRLPATSAYYLDSQVDDETKDEAFRAYVDGLRVVDPQAYAVPPRLATVLRPYQVEGFRWLNAVCDKGFGGILADEMGLGKTIQLLSLLVARRDEARGVGPSLIVCPASLVYNWEAECRRFAPELRVAVVAGSKTERRALLGRIRRAQAARAVPLRDDGADDGDATFALRTTARTLGDTADDGWQGATTPLPEDGWDASGDGPLPDLLITSYDLLRRDVEEYEGIDFYCMTLDEAQYVKNHATKASKAVRSVSARHRFALTGTPIENRLAELWSIFDFLMPGMLGSYRHFRDRFEQPVLSGDERAQARLQAFVGPFILRRLKSDVLKDLPDKIENVITVQLEGEQRRLYAALEQRLRASINKTRDVDFRNDRIQVLSQLTRLRQVCCDPRLVYENAGQLDAPSDGRRRTASPSAKLDAIQELVESCRDAGRKVLIFSQFTSYLDLIAERLRSIGMAYDTITGATPKKRRLELVDSFNTDDTPVFLISLKAGNTGLNLTGACVVIHADPWWNAAAQNQATDRAHRIGQTQDVNVYQIVAKDTIEERILSLQQSKTDLATRFVDEASSSTGGSMAALTREDLLALLGA